MRIGEKLEILRCEGKLTQARLTEIIGGDQSTLSKVLSGKSGRYLNTDQILKAARHFRVTVESLLDDDMDIERITDDERSILRTVRKIGIEEALDRLWLTSVHYRELNQTSGKPAEHPKWGYMGNHDPGTTSGGTASRPVNRAGA